MKDWIKVFIVLSQLVHLALSSYTEMPECKLNPSKVFKSNTKVVPTMKKIEYIPHENISLDFHLFHDCYAIYDVLKAYNQDIIDCPSMTMKNLISYSINSKDANFTINSISNGKFHTDLSISNSTGDIDLGIYLRLKEIQIEITGHNCTVGEHCYNNCAGINATISDIEIDHEVIIQLFPEYIYQSEFLDFSLLFLISFTLTLAILFGSIIYLKFYNMRRNKDYMYPGLCTEAPQVKLPEASSDISP